MRPLHGAPVDLTLVVTLGLLLVPGRRWPRSRWEPSDGPQPAVAFFNGAGFRIGYVQVTWHEVVAVVRHRRHRARRCASCSSAAAPVIAMRAVVDNPRPGRDGRGRPVRIQQLSWAIGCSLAALAGILLAPLARLDILMLTLLVINGYAAAIIGRLRNLPLDGRRGDRPSASGSLRGRLLTGPVARDRSTIIPMVVLFVVLIAAAAGPAAGRVVRRRRSPPGWPACGRRSSGAGSSSPSPRCLSGDLSAVERRRGRTASRSALVLLSLLLLTGYGGMVSSAR